MHVMAAHMPHQHRVPIAIFRLDLACIGQAGCFRDRKRIHVRAQHDSGTIAVAQHANDTGLAYSRRHLVTGGPKPVRG
jgi:hypothetical protein